MHTHRYTRVTLSLCLTAALLLLCACNGGTEQKALPAKVSYTILRDEPLTLVTELPGRVSAYMVSEVRPQVSGIVQKRLFEEGSDVAAGQTLYQIDPALFQADFNNAEANLAKANANEVSARLLAERYQKLIKVNAVSRQECDDAEAAHIQAGAEVRAAREAVNTAAINLGYTRVTAPVAGRVGRSYVTPGALVTRNQSEALSTIQHLDVVYVDITQANTELLRLARLSQGENGASGVSAVSGNKASATVRLRLEDGTPYARRPGDGLSGPEGLAGLGVPGGPGGQEPDWMEGELLFSEVTIDKSTGAVTLRAAFPNPDHVLLPGMHVRAALIEGDLESALLVPQRCVSRGNRGEAFVYILHETEPAGNGEGSFTNGEESFTVERRPVEIARSVGNRWLIASGLSAGERLLFEGHIKARPGQTVRGSDMGQTDVFSASAGNSQYVR